MPLTSMRLTEKESSAESGEIEATRPEFPFGLTLHLDEEALSKLNISELPEVGNDMSLFARVRVDSISSHGAKGGEKKRSVALQITDMALEKNADIEAAAEELYGSS